MTLDGDGSIIIDPKDLMPGAAMLINIDEHGALSTSVVADEVQSSDAVVVEWSEMDKSLVAVTP